MKTPFFDKDEAGSNGTPTRDQVAIQDTWDLTLLYPTDDAWQADFTKLQQTYEEVAQWKGKVGQSAQTLLEVLEYEKAQGLLIERLYHYASLKSSEDSSDA